MIASAQGLRTIWLMGAKTRIIPEFIEGAVRDLLPEGDTLVDVCAGTGVVARSFASRHRVIANDIQAFSATLASAHLEGDPQWRAALEDLDPASDLDAAFASHLGALAELAPEALGLEDQLLPRVIDELSARQPGDAVADYRRYLEITPDPARPEASAFRLFEPLRTRFSEMLRERRRDATTTPYALMTLYYTNVYYGLRQAMVIDSYRAAIAGLSDRDPHRVRKQTLYLAALIGAASISTSGTSHFAQPRSVRKDSELLAVARRRSINIEDEFQRALEALRREWCERPDRGPHRVFSMSVEALVAADGPLVAERPGLVYLDPPYTSDNYSRFYHLLETLVSYDYPALERRGDHLTQGRYPERGRRFQSGFCSPTRVEATFRGVVESVRALGANLLVSYSDENGLLLRHWHGRGESDPRRRFRDLFGDYYSRVEIRERELMHSGQGDSNRSVSELLVLCEV